MNIDIRTILLYSTGNKMKVTGGFGLTEDDPVMILENHPDLADKIEKSLINCLTSLFRLYDPEIEPEETIQSGDGYFRKITIKHVYEDQDREERIRKTPIFFDVSASHTNIGKDLEQVKNRQELDLIYDNRYWEPDDTSYLNPNFIDAAALAITHGSHDFFVEDLRHIYDISEDEADSLFDALDECGLLASNVHEYYQKHFGDIYPDGYWELIW